MAAVKYEVFKKLVDSFDEFNVETLKALYTKYEKVIIDGHFERYFHSLVDEESAEEFIGKFSAYFEQKEKDSQAFVNDNINLKSDKKISSIVNSIFSDVSEYLVMNPDEEKKFGYDLKKGKEELIILKDKYFLLDKKFEDEEKRYSKVISLYPDLNLEKIFLSIKDNEDVELLQMVKKLRFKLNDELILHHDINNINKYLKLCKNGIPDINILKSNFNNLNFDNIDVLSKEEYKYQMNLLNDYIIAKYNYGRRNLKLVISIAKNYSLRIPFEDAFQMGSIGLFRAIDKFDISKGNKFSTYATWWIRQCITRDIADFGDIIRKPVHMIDSISRYKKYVHEYEKINGEEPSLNEISEFMGISISDVENLTKYMRDVISLDVHIGEEDDRNETIGSFVADETVHFEDDVIDKDRFDRINDILRNGLTERELFVLYNRNGLNDEQREFSLEEIGQIVGVTRERIRQIEAKALRKARNRTRCMR